MQSCYLRLNLVTHGFISFAGDHSTEFNTTIKASDLATEISFLRFPEFNQMLPSAPSFSVFSVVEDEENDDQEPLERAVTIGESISEAEKSDFSFGRKISDMGLIEEESEDYNEGGLQGVKIGEGEEVLETLMDDEGFCKRLVDEYPSHPLFLRNYAKHLKSKGDLPGAKEYYWRAILVEPKDGELLLQFAKLIWELNHDEESALNFFKLAIQASPEDSDVLAAYASFLWEIDDSDHPEEAEDKDVELSKDRHRAIEYYQHATLLEPNNGELLMQYAKLVWELNRDPDTAQKLFERAAQASPDDSEILGAYASFLWEIDDDTEEEFAPREDIKGEDGQSYTSLEDASKKAIDPVQDPHASGDHDNNHFLTEHSQDVDVHSYYRKLAQDPHNPSILKKYARYLYQCKGDIQGAEDYYSRALLADPEDGEVMSEYAKLIWQFHHNSEKALFYLEQAVKTSPDNSDVLAAYASFLWDTEEGDGEDDATERRDQARIYSSQTDL